MNPTRDMALWRSAWQSSRGAIRSHIQFANGHSTADSNNFITALWLREVRRLPALQDENLIACARRKAIDFLCRGGDLDQPGCWGFWPPEQRPKWAAGVGADIDDTAIILLELLHADGVAESLLQQVVYKVFSQLTVRRSNYPQPAWIEPGCFLTWIPQAQARKAQLAAAGNVVDVTANCNVLALLALIGAKSAPGYKAACACVNKAAGWANMDDSRWKAISPYYPNAREFIRAAEHAIECNATEILPALEQAYRHIDGNPGTTDAICRSAFGHTIWYSPALQAIRSPLQQQTRHTDSREAVCA